MQMKTNKNGVKLLATAMVLVMAFSAVVVVSGESSDAATDITYISGKIMDDQTYGAGAIVVQNGDLSIESGKKLIIAQGASFTVASGFTLTVNERATFQVNNGALVVIDGTLDVKAGGIVENRSIFDNTSKVNGELAGFFVNGAMNVAKQGTLRGIPAVAAASAAAESTSATCPTPYDKSGLSTISSGAITGTVTGDTVKTYTLSGTVPVHMNGAGNWGAWVGVTVSSLPTGQATINIDGRTINVTNQSASDDFWTTAGKIITVTVTPNSGTAVTFIIDATNVTVSGPSGQIIVNGALTTTSSGLTHSTVKDQIISVSETGKVSLKGDVDGTVVSAFTDSKNPYTYGAVLVDATETTNNSNTVVDLSFTAKAEKIDQAFIGAEPTPNKKAQDLILDVSGSIQGSYVGTTDHPVSLTVLKTVPSAGMNNDGTRKVMYYSNGQATPASSEVPMAGKVSVSGNLSVSKNATFTTQAGSILDVSGKVVVDGLKSATGATSTDRSTLSLNGIMNVTGTVKIGAIASGESTSRVGAVELSIANGSAFLIVEGDGVISLQDYVVAENYSNAPYASFGASFTDEDDVYWIMSLPAAIVAAQNGDISNINLWTIPAVAGTIMKKDYKVSSDLVIPDGISLCIDGTLVVASGVTLTIQDGADISTLSRGCLIDVKGTLVDETLMNDANLYKDEIEATKVHIKADVRSIDADETAYTYTTLKSALAGTDAKIELFGDVSVSGTLTIPEDKTVVLGAKKLTVGNDSELTVDGILVANGTGKVILKNAVVESNKAAAVLTINNIVVASAIYDNSNTENPVAKPVAGIYAEGTIGDFKDDDFILAPAVAAENSLTLGNLQVKEKTNVSGKLVFTASADADDATLTINADSVFGEIVLAGYTLAINSEKVLTATVTAETSDGVSSVKLDKVKALSFLVIEDDSGDKPVTRFTIDASSTVTLSGKLTTTQGVTYLKGALNVGTYDGVNKIGSILTVASGSEMIIPENSTITSVYNDAVPTGYAGLVIDGKMTVVKGTINATVYSGKVDGVILVNGELFITETKTNDIKGDLIVKGTLNVDTAEKTAGKLKISSDLIVGEKSDSLGATATVIGAISIPTGATLTVYPGADMSGALINYDPATGESAINKVDYMIDGSVYMSIYGDDSAMIAVPGTITVIGFETIASTDWYLDSEFGTRLVADTYFIKDYSAVYADFTPASANVKISVGTGMSLWIDGVKYNTGAEETFDVGEYNVEVTINPGYKGTSKILLNGVQISNGKMVIAPEMADTTVVLSAIGDISIDAGDTPAPVQPTEKDDGMGITDYLLIVLVVLAAVLVVIVAIRMMRS